MLIPCECLCIPTSDIVCLRVLQEQVIPCLLRLKQASDPGLGAAVREALALVGYHKPVKGRGFRILSIDGGGLRYKFSSAVFLLDELLMAFIYKCSPEKHSVNWITICFFTCGK